MPDLSVTEILWTVLALAGAAMTTTALENAWQDLETIRSSGRNGVLKIYARGRRRRELGRLVVQVGFVVLGVFSIARPGTSDPSNPYSWLLIFVMFSMSVQLLFQSYTEYLDRQEIERELEAKLLVTDAMTLGQALDVLEQSAREEHDVGGA